MSEEIDIQQFFIMVKVDMIMTDARLSVLENTLVELLEHLGIKRDDGLSFGEVFRKDMFARIEQHFAKLSDNHPALATALKEKLAEELSRQEQEGQGQD